MFGDHWRPQTLSLVQPHCGYRNYKHSDTINLKKKQVEIKKTAKTLIVCLLFKREKQSQFDAIVYARDKNSKNLLQKFAAYKTPKTPEISKVITYL